MCEFLSFVLAKTDDGLKILAAESLSDHSDIITRHNLTGTEYYEAEWTIDEETGEDVLDIRIPDDCPEAKRAQMESWVRGQYSTRQKLVNHLIEQMLEAGLLPNMLRYEHPNWNERTQRLFACDCAEHVLSIYEREYPDDGRPRKAIEVARRFADGEATPEELAAAERAAWAAARAAAERAAWAAARDAAERAAWAAARDAARDAAWAAAWDAAWDAARAAERAWQIARLQKHLRGEA